MVNEQTEISLEQDYVNSVYSRLDEVRGEVTQKLEHVRRTQVGGNHQNRSERDAFAVLYEDQLLRLRNAEEGLCFGRIDDRSQETTYIGRIGLSAADREQILMDWRAPASEPFYRATAANPGGIVRRRHIATRRRTVLSVEDDVLDLDALDSAERESLHGEGALIAALDAHRTGRMNDIVATIQAEQDRIIRKDLAGVIVVQGGPGTGKTAVALHRAAYLLYQHRKRIEKSGVLLVGPSPVFLKYIEQVLPSLGETGAVLLTPGQLLPGIETTVRDGRLTSAIKGDLRMVEVIARTVRNYQRTLAAPVTLNVGKYQVSMTPPMVKAARDRARRTGDTHNEARDTFATALMRSLAEELARVSQLEFNDATMPELLDDLRMSADARREINSLWLPLSATGVLSALFAKPSKLVAASDGILSFEEMARLRRPAGSPITVDDVPLLDEVAELIGAVPGSRPVSENTEQEYAQAVLDMTGTGDMVSAQAIADAYAGTGTGWNIAEHAENDREWTFGHLVVDEAQELTPMQLRLLFRRVPSKSATLVGDLAQASEVEVDRTWESMLSPHVGDRFALEQLTVSYRTPATIMKLANDLLSEYFPTLQVPTPVREGTFTPELDDYETFEEVMAALPQAVADELATVGGGRVAVIAADAQMSSVARAVQGHTGLDVGVGASGIDHTVAVLTPYGAKGLEFDSVIIVEPSQIAPLGDANGVGELYVALTRSTARLRVMGSDSSVLSPFVAARPEAQHRE